jgi:hypothetical protein
MGKGRVPAPRVVPPLDVPEDLHARLDLSPEDSAVQELALEAGEEGFGHRIGMSRQLLLVQRI